MVQGRSSATHRAEGRAAEGPFRDRPHPAQATEGRAARGGKGGPREGGGAARPSAEGASAREARPPRRRARRAHKKGGDSRDRSPRVAGAFRASGRQGAPRRQPRARQCRPRGHGAPAPSRPAGARRHTEGRGGGNRSHKRNRQGKFRGAQGRRGAAKGRGSPPRTKPQANAPAGMPPAGRPAEWRAKSTKTPAAGAKPRPRPLTPKRGPRGWGRARRGAETKRRERAAESPPAESPPSGEPARVGGGRVGGGQRSGERRRRRRPLSRARPGTQGPRGGGPAAAPRRPRACPRIGEGAARGSVGFPSRAHARACASRLQAGRGFAVGWEVSFLEFLLRCYCTAFRSDS